MKSGQYNIGFFAEKVLLKIMQWFVYNVHLGNESVLMEYNSSVIEHTIKFQDVPSVLE